MLAWLDKTTAFAEPLRASGRISRPTRNMNSTRPSWLSAYNSPRLFAGNRPCIAAGEIRPSRDGPSRMPAAISPITSGWPAKRNAAAISRAVARITAICRNSSFSSGIASLHLAMLLQTSPGFLFAVLHSKIPMEETQSEKYAIDGQKYGQVAHHRGARDRRDVGTAAEACFGGAERLALRIGQNGPEPCPLH